MFIHFLVSNGDKQHERATPFSAVEKWSDILASHQTADEVVPLTIRDHIVGRDGWQASLAGRYVVLC
jgi:hypothetical protein